MKETINANIGQQVFTLDRYAYDRLNAYLQDIRSRISVDTDEIVSDIEIRIAEIFREEHPSPLMVVTLAMVERVIRRIGAPEDFGAEGKEDTNNKKSRDMKQLRRSRTDRSIAGVCGGLAKYLGIDSTALRIATFLLIFFGGMSLWVYIILWLIIPEE